MGVRCVARGTSDRPRVPATIDVQSGDGQSSRGERAAYFGSRQGWASVPVVGRSQLSPTPEEGPMIVEEDNSVTVVNPGWRASLDEWSNIVLEPA